MPRTASLSPSFTPLGLQREQRTPPPPPMAAQVPKPTPPEICFLLNVPGRMGLLSLRAYEKYNKKNWMRQTGGDGAEKAAGRAGALGGRQGLRAPDG